MNIVLCGTPNVGKTTLFNTLTHSHQRTGNYHGVTVQALSKRVKNNTFIDVPGVYALTPYSLEEANSLAPIRTADVLIFIADATTLDLSLQLFAQLVPLHKPCLIYLSKLDLLKKRGGRLDVKKLQTLVNCPVCITPKQVLNNLNNATLPQAVTSKQIGYDQGSCQLNRAEKLLYHPVVATLLTILCMFLLFFLAFHKRGIGMYGKRWMEGLVANLTVFLTAHTQNPLVASLAGSLCNGVGGVLTFLPQLTLIYLYLGILEQSGIMSALSFVTDGLWQKINLTGKSTFSLLTGFGCTATAISSCENQPSFDSKLRTVSTLFYLPCGAKLPVLFTFLSPLFADPFLVICLFYIVAVGVGVVITAFFSGERQPILCEVVPLATFPIKAPLTDLFFALKSFIIKVSTTIFLFTLLSWGLSHLTFRLAYCNVEDSMLSILCQKIPLFQPMGLDQRMTYCLLSGLVAKENILASLTLLYGQAFTFTLPQSLAMSTFLVLCPPCITALATSAKSVGLGKTARLTCVQFILALTFSYLVFYLSGIVL